MAVTRHGQRVARSGLVSGRQGPDAFGRNPQRSQHLVVGPGFVCHTWPPGGHLAGPTVHGRC
jgi:hypothetical protein